MRGYFGIGVDRISKTMNVGNLFRSAHAFGAGFVFTVQAAYAMKTGRAHSVPRNAGRRRGVGCWFMR